MKRAISIHRRDFISIIALLVGAIVVTAYIFAHQPAFTGVFGLFGKNYYTVKANFSSASAVTSGQGQTVDIAGVEVGQIGGVSVQNGHAVVTMNIYRKYAPIYRNATVLLRPRTPLKDMYLELDPGTRGAGRVPNGSALPVGATNPDIDFSAILKSLDSDTRDYLLLLLASGAQAFRDNGSQGPQPSAAVVADLRGVFKRFAPLNRDTATFTRLLAHRTANIRRAINGLAQVTNSLGSVQGQLTSLINSSNTNFQAISSQTAQLQQALTLFPSTLQQSAVTFQKLRGFGLASTSSAQRLLPWAQALAPALEATRPLFHDTTPVIQNQLRPFSVAVQPVAKILAPAAAQLAKATPPLSRSIGVLNSLFNELAYQPAGGLQGYLYWGSWLSHIAASLTSQQDAHGPILRGTFMASCSELQLFEVSLEKSVPSIANLLALLNAPDWSQTPGVTNGNCPIG
ncbi:MAG TPA: MlaD family protein [Solirubrobacteraceae bacterium]|nr:MlaD family protein [Solirubrobacteraceae bacterium]